MYNRYYQKKKVEYQGPQEASILRSSKDGWFYVSAPYSPTITPKLVIDFKTWIESSDRKWNPETKFWEFKQIHLGRIITMLKKYYGNSITQNLTTEEPITSNPFKALFAILKSMPNGNMDKIYAALAQAIHPDHGGSDEQMKKLNEAYQEAKK